MWMSHVTHMDEPRHAFLSVIVGARLGKQSTKVSHVTHMNESCHTYEWVMSHIWMSHVTHVSESYHTSRVMSHMWVSRITHIHEPRHSNEWVMPHKCLSHAAQESSHACDWKKKKKHDVTQNTWRDSITCVGWVMTWLKNTWHDSISFISVTPSHFFHRMTHPTHVIESRYLFLSHVMYFLVTSCIF